MDLELAMLKHISRSSYDKWLDKNTIVSITHYFSLGKRTLGEPTPSFLDSITLPR